MNLDVNLRHFLEVPKDLAIKRGEGGKEAAKRGLDYGVIDNFYKELGR